FPPLGRWRTALLWAIGAWATLLAAIAPASFLANFTHWSAAGSPGGYLFTAIGVISVVLATATLAAFRFVRALRAQPLAPAGLLRAAPGRLGLTRLPDASRAQRRRALLAVGGVGLAAVAACGYPSWGSKFGGTIAMVPGFVLLLFLAAGLRITWRKLLAAALS